MHSSRISRTFFLLVGVGLGVACTGTPDLDPDGGGPDPSVGGDGGAPPVGFCAGTGPIIDLGSTSTTTTTPGACDTDSFATAVCSCSDLAVDGYLAVASNDPMQPTAGSVGLNRDSNVRGYASVGGSVVIAGERSLGFYGYLRSGGRLETAGPVAVADSGFAAGYLEVDGDTRIDGNLSVLGYARIGGGLRQPAGAATPIVLDVAGARTVGPVTVAPPCACNESQLPDLEGLIAGAAASNDNATLSPPLAPDRLRDVVGVASVTLPCGHYYLDEISGAGLIHIKATGRVALHVRGDIAPTGLFVIEVVPGAEVDLVVGGSLRSTGAGAFGALDRPGSLRVYVAGAGDVRITGATGFAGNLYAPRARIVAPGATYVAGSLFARDIDIDGFLQVGYDAGVRGECGPVLL